MLKNYFKIAYRSLIKNKLYTCISISGITLGVASFILISLFVIDELSVDQFHSKKDRIYRVTEILDKLNTTAGEVIENAEMGTSALALKFMIEKQISEVESIVRLDYIFNKKAFRSGTNTFYEESVVFSDPEFFAMFDFQLISGNPEISLFNPYTVFISQSVARKYFGSENPFGKTLVFENEYNLEVAGVFKDLPKNSHIQFDILLSMETQYALGLEKDNWNSSGYTYLLLNKDTTPISIIAQLNSFVHPYSDTKSYNLQPLSDIFLYSKLSLASNFGNVSDIRYLYLFSAIAFLILIIAGINYVNISTSRAFKRLKEISIRKVAGANRKQLVLQLLSESLLLAFISLLFAIFITELSLPFFNSITDKELEIATFLSPFYMGMGIMFIFSIGICSGIYPAFFMTKFNLANSLKGSARPGKKPVLRKGLVAFQICVSVILITGTVVITKQLNYLSHKNLGFKKEMLITVTTHNYLKEKASLFKDRVSELAGVDKVSASSAVPGNLYGIIFPQTSDVQDYTGDKKYIIFQYFRVDEHYIDTFEMGMKHGNAFNDPLISSTPNPVILNEAAVRKIGWTNPINKTIKYGGSIYTVIGIVKDFHHSSLKGDIEPLFMILSETANQFITARVHSQNLTSVIEGIQKAWNQTAPEFPLEYHFIDDIFEEMYREDQKLAGLINSFSILAALIAMLGLFGLACYTTEVRQKEIGIRKVLGATLSNILTMLSTDFLKFIIIGFIAGSGFAYWIMNKWLQNFSYKIDFDTTIIFLVGAIVIALTILSVGYQMLKATLINPVDTLTNQ